MSDPFIEISEFTGRACGIISRDLADFSQPLAEAFRRGWRTAWEEEKVAPAAPQTSEPT
jgi:hypothetical protein